MKKLLFIISILFAFNANSQTGEALNFDGVNDYVTINSPYLPEYTIETWVNLNSLGQRNIIAGSGSTGPLNSLPVALYINAAGKFEHLAFDVANKTLQSPITISTGVWYHVVISAKSGGNMKIVVNGNETVSSFQFGTLWTSLTQFRLGCQTMSGYNYFSGTLDEVRIWNRQLCLAEIINNKDGEITTSAPGLMKNYHFNQGVASGSNPGLTSLTDASGNSSNGTLINFALNGSISNFVSLGAVTSGVAVSSFVLPTINISPSTTLACVGSVVTLTATGTSTSYEWVGGGATNTQAVSINSPSSYTQYVYGYDANFCYPPPASVTIQGEGVPSISNDYGYFCSGSSYTISPTVNFYGPITSYTYSTGSSVITPTSTAGYTVYGANAAGCVGSATGTVEVCGASGKSLDMNGSDDFLQTGITYSVFTSNWTLECWAKSPASPTTSEHNGPMYGENMGIIWDHGNGFFLGGASVKASSGTYYAASYGTLSPNTWYHLAATYDGTVLRAYKNGVLTNSVTTNGGLGVATGSLMLGRHPTLNQFWNGTIDDARVWTVARTCSEINQFMNTELVGNEIGLKAYYKFNEGIPAANNISITTTSDATGNGYNCSIGGFSRTGTSSNYMLGAPFDAITNNCGVATGINEQTKNSIIIYPNPTSNILNIEVQQETKISIVNVLGEVIKTQTINGKTSINVSDLNTGVYFIQDTKSGKAIKFIKE